MNLSTDIQLKQEQLKHCNYLQVIHVPDGVDCYISQKRTFDIDEANKVSNGSILRIKLGDELSQNKPLYLTTIGTNSGQSIVLDTKSLNSNTNWIEHKQNNSIAEFNQSTEDNFVQQSITLNNSLLAQNSILNKFTSLLDINNSINTSLSQLYKNIDPYNFPLFYSGTHSGDTVTTILNKTLVCDKIKIDLSCYCDEPYTYDYNIRVLIDNIVVCSLSNSKGFSAYRNNSFPYVVLESIKYKNIKILASSQTTNGTGVAYTLQEYSKKV